MVSLVAATRRLQVALIQETLDTSLRHSSMISSRLELIATKAFRQSKCPQPFLPFSTITRGR